MWLFLKNQLDMILDIVDPDDEFRFLLKNKRCHLPTAELYPDREVESKPGSRLLVIQGNKPSLVRYGLIMLILHEKAHYEFIKKYNDYSVDHHTDERFLKIERDLMARVDELIFEEHD